MALQSKSPPFFGPCPGVISGNFGKNVIFIGGIGVSSIDLENEDGGVRFIDRIALGIRATIYFVVLPNPFSADVLIQGIEEARSRAGDDSPVIGYSFGAYFALSTSTPKTPHVILWSPLLSPISTIFQPLGLLDTNIGNGIYSWMNSWTGQYYDLIPLLPYVQCNLSIIMAKSDWISGTTPIRTTLNSLGKPYALYQIPGGHAHTLQNEPFLLAALSNALHQNSTSKKDSQ